MSDPAPQVHCGAGHLPDWWQPPDWEEEQRLWKQQEHAFEVERERKLAQHPANCLCNHCQHRRADHPS